MGKKLAFGLGMISAAAYVVAKNMTPAEKKMVRDRVAQAATNVKETALKYDRYLHEYLASAEYQQQRQDWEAQFMQVKQATDSCRNNSGTGCYGKQAGNNSGHCPGGPLRIDDPVR